MTSNGLCLGVRTCETHQMPTPSVDLVNIPGFTHHVTSRGWQFEICTVSMNTWKKGVTAEYPAVLSGQCFKEQDIHICHTCLVLAMRLCSCQDLPSLLEYVSWEKKWLHGYTVVNTSSPPWNMLVGIKVAMQLCSCQDHPSPSKYVSKERSGYVATQSLRTM